MNYYVKLGIYCFVYAFLIVGFFVSYSRTLQRKEQKKNLAPWPWFHAFFLFTSIFAPLFFEGHWKWLALLSLMIIIAVYREKNEPDSDKVPKGYGPSDETL